MADEIRVLEATVVNVVFKEGLVVLVLFRVVLRYTPNPTIRITAMATRAVTPKRLLFLLLPIYTA